MTVDSKEVLRITNLTVNFQSEGQRIEAVRGVNLHVRRGRVLALVGESGSGKSVTAMSVLGLLPRTATTSGSIQLAAEEIGELSSSALRNIRGRRVGMVFQEPMTALNPSMPIGAQVAETMRNHGLPRSEASTRAIQLLEDVGIADARARADRYPHEFSGGQRQRVVIAIALACQPDLIIADEPTTALDVTVQAEILDLLRTLVTEHNTGLLIITHNMGVVADVADDVAVMHRGIIEEHGTVEQVLSQPQAEYSQTLLAAVPTLPTSPETQPSHCSATHPDQSGQPTQICSDETETIRTAPRTSRGAAPAIVTLTDAQYAEDTMAQVHLDDALTVDGMRVIYGRGSRAVHAVNGVSLHVGAKEIVGVVGESGSGKSTLGKAAIGLLPLTDGSVHVLGEPLHKRGRHSSALRSRIGVMFQDPASSLDPRMTVGESVAEPFRMHPRLAERPNRRERRKRVASLLDAVQLPSGTIDRYPHELSGGQRQRVALARSLALKPGLLLADEPTSALDVSVQEQTLAVLREVHDQFGFGCLFISHDLAVVHEVSDRVAVMQGGEVVEEGDATDVLVHPSHPYSRRLVAAVPAPDPVQQRTRRELRLAAG